MVVAVKIDSVTQWCFLLIVMRKPAAAGLGHNIKQMSGVGIRTRKSKPDTFMGLEFTPAAVCAAAGCDYRIWNATASQGSAITLTVVSLAASVYEAGRGCCVGRCPLETPQGEFPEVSQLPEKPPCHLSTQVTHININGQHQ